MTTLVDCDTKYQHKQTKQMDINQVFADRHKPRLHSQDDKLDSKTLIFLAWLREQTCLHLHQLTHLKCKH